MLATQRRDDLKDGVLIVLALVFLAVQVLYLLHQMKVIALPLPWEKNGGVGVTIGKVVEKRSMLRHRAQKSLSWFPMGSGDPIELHDTLLTGPDSWAKIEITGEGEIDLESDTLLKFSEEPNAHSAAVLNLEIGQGMVRVKSKKNPVNVQLRSREIALTPDSEVIFSKPAMTAQSQVQVRKGEVTLVPTTSDGIAKNPDDVKVVAVALKAGEAMQIEAGRALARIQTNLKIEPKYPLSGARIVGKSQLQSVGIYWDGDEGSELEIGLDKDFLAAKTFRTNGKSAQVELPSGQYYWRVRRDVAVSEPRDFTLLPPVAYKLAGPEDGKAFKEGSTVKLTWLPVDGASHYYVEVSRTEDFKDYLLTSDVTATTSRLENVKPGTYYWRVRATHKALGNWPPSAIQSFVVKKRLGAPKPKGAKVLEDKQSAAPRETGRRWASLKLDLVKWLVTLARAESGPPTWWLEFAWEPLEGASGYKLEIYADRELSEPLKKVEVREATVPVELPKIEKYFWRVAAIDELGQQSAWSQPQRMLAVQAKAVAAPRVARESVSMPAPPREVTSVGEWPAWLPTGAGLGGGGSFGIDSTTAADFTAKNSGPLGSVNAVLYRETPTWDWEARFQMRFARFTAQSAGGGGVANANENLKLFEGQFLVSRLLGYGGLNWSFGAAFRQDADFFLAAPDTASVRVRSYFPLQAGVSFAREISNRAYWRADLLLEGAPLGALKGVGLWARSRLGYALSSLPITPELLIQANPSLLWLGAEEKRRFSSAFLLSLLIKVRFDG